MKQVTPEILTTTPPAPDYLSAAASLEWAKIAPAAVATGTLTDGDLRALALLCECLASESAMREVLGREGVTVATGNDGMKPHPCLRALETARTQAHKLMADFGLTPKSRVGTAGVKPAPKWAPYKF